jgi:hypothetical protein
MIFCEHLNNLFKQINKKTKIIAATVFLLILTSIISIYFLRIQIYTPVIIEIAPKDTVINCFQVYRISPTGVQYEVNKISDRNSYEISNGYYNHIIIKSKTENFNFNLKTKITVISQKDGNPITYESNIDDDCLIITQVGTKSFYKKLCVIVSTNLEKLIFFSVLLFVLLIWLKFACYTKPKFELKFKIFTIISLIIFLIISYLLVITASVNTYPNAEDIALSTPIGNNNFIENAIRILLVYDARYTANILYGLSPFAIGGIEFHKINSILVVITNMVIIFSSLIVFFRSKKDKLRLFVISLFITLLHIVFSPGIAFDYFYIGSSYVYLFGILSAILWASLFYNGITEVQYKKRTYKLIFSFILLFLSYGTIETNIFLNAYIVSIFAWFIIKYKSEFKHELIVIIAIAIISSIYIFLIPGNTHRELGSPIEYTSSYFFETFSTTIKPFFNILTKWTILNPVSIPTIILSLIIIQKQKYSFDFKTKDFAIVFIMGILSMYFIYYIFAIKSHILQ